MFQGKICFPSWLQEMNIQFTRADFVLCSLHVLLHTNVAPETDDKGSLKWLCKLPSAAQLKLFIPLSSLKLKI